MVALLVDFQADLPLEPLAAFVAGEPLDVFLRTSRLGRVVGDHVLRHRGAPAECLAALRATVRAVVCVFALVQEECRLEQERHVAFITVKRFEPRMPQSVYTQAFLARKIFRA